MCKECSTWIVCAGCSLPHPKAKFLPSQLITAEPKCRDCFIRAVAQEGGKAKRPLSTSTIMKTGKTGVELQKAAGRALGGDVGDVRGRPAADNLVCQGVKCKGKTQQPRSQFSKRMLKAGDRKSCNSCVAAARVKRTAAMTSERFICFGVRCAGRRRPRSEFSGKQLKCDEKRCRSCIDA
jgi:hypothetical protein